MPPGDVTATVERCLVRHQDPRAHLGRPQRRVVSGKTAAHDEHVGLVYLTQPVKRFRHNYPPFFVA